MTSLILAAALPLAVPEAPWVNGGEAPANAKNVTGGVNWMATSGFVCPKYDERGNILMNPSFESGDRYWWHGRDESDRVASQIVTNFAHSGAHSLHYTRDLGNLRLGQVVFKEHARYAVSCYAMLPKGGSASVSFAPRGNEVWPKGAKLTSPDGKPLQPGVWTRLTGVLETPAKFHEGTVWVSASPPDCYLDDFQVEEGELTEYRGNPFGVDLLLDSPEEVYSNARTDAKPRIVLTGPKEAKGEVSVKVKDFFNRRVAAVEQKFDLSSGALEIALDDATLPKGVLVAEVTVRPLAERAAPLQGGRSSAERAAPLQGGRSSAERAAPLQGDQSLRDWKPFTDYLRWAKIDCLDNTHRHKNLMGVSGCPQYAADSASAESVYRRQAHFGFGACAYTSRWNFKDPKHYEYLPAEADLAFAKKWGYDFFGCCFNPGSGGHFYLNASPGDAWKPKIRFGAYTPMSEEYPEDFLQWVETNVCAVAARHPEILHWTLPTEPDHGSAKSRDAYAVYALRVLKGLKAGNPKCDLMPYGAYNMFQQGRGSVIDFMRRLKRADPEADRKFPYVEIHTYRERPEAPDVEEDLLAFLKGLADVGYPDIKVKIGEGSYYYPVAKYRRGDQGYWSVHDKDCYSGIRIPTYDLGWGEQIGAAQTIREALVYYRHADRVIFNCPWSQRFVDGVRPIAWLAANAAMAKLLGDSTPIKDIRFAAGSRAYVFDDGHGSTVAVCWKGDADFDRGETPATRMALGAGCGVPGELEVFDLMGNACQVKVEGEGEQRKIILPLSGFPVYLKVANAKRAALIEAIESCEVAADMEKLPLSILMTIVSPSEGEVKVTNPLTRALEADVEIGGRTRHVALAGKASETIRCPLPEPVPYDRFGEIAVPVKVTFRGKVFDEKYSTRALAVKKVCGRPDWSKIPAAPVGNPRRTGMGDAQKPWTGAPDFAAKLQLAYDADNLYLRLDVTDDLLSWRDPPPDDWQNQYKWDAVQLFFDAMGNAREKAKAGSFGYDMDDFSYELLPSNATTAVVYRRLAPDHQYTGGALTGYQSKVVEGGLKCDIVPREGGYAYEVTFPKDFIRPIPLDGSVRPGLSLEIFDRDSRELPKGWWDESKSAAWLLSDIPPTPDKIGAFQCPHKYTTLVFEEK